MPTNKNRKQGRLGQELVPQEPLAKKRKLKRGKGSHEPVPLTPVQHAVLDQYYPQLLTLRDYVLLKLPATSRIRRRKITSTGSSSAVSTGQITEIERVVGQVLDTTLVGVAQQTKSIPDKRWEHWETYASQKGDESHVTLSDGLTGARFSQSEIVEFVIWMMFSKSKKTGTWPKHLLCDGFRRDHSSRLQAQSRNRTTNIPDMISIYPNQRVELLKQSPWPEILKLLGNSGDRIMMDLLLDSAMFLPVGSCQGNYYQISGQPLFDTELLAASNEDAKQISTGFQRSTAEINFVRNRMLYARPALNARGLVNFGLRHIHVLNRSPYVKPNAEPASDANALASKNDANTLRIMMYIFPQQFGLHNAFNSKVDFSETSQRLKDYTLREDEIQNKFGELAGDEIRRKKANPKRLRGKARDLVRKLQILHSRCSYSKLLQHYCPVNDGLDPKEAPLSSAQMLVELSSSTSQVSAFCQSVLSKLVPDEFWGTGSVQEHNKKVVMKKVDQFIHLRRFEGMYLHEVMQGMKVQYIVISYGRIKAADILQVTDIGWLAPEQLMAHKTSQTDIQKRLELSHDFLYYVFDSLLIPLIRSNFYVTESNTHKYQLFFFRHDVWKYVAEPAMAAVKSKMFEEVSIDAAMKILDSRALGFSQVRLLPKGNSIRPIMNLRRRMVTNGNSKTLGSSINTILGPVHTMLQLEKSMNPTKLGSTMFSVGDIYKRVKNFKSNILRAAKPLYFAKVDVQAAFDTIPQSAIVGLLDSIPQQHSYRIAKHAEISSKRLDGSADSGTTKRKSKPARKWLSTALKDRDTSTFLQLLENQPQTAQKKDTVFIDSVVKKQYDTSQLLQLVASHIQQNLVKIGKKFYRQKKGIPQGSVLSSILCNYFYADLELHVLKFLDADDCLLLRLIDDFLLITTDRDKAARFVETMHHGVPEYGVQVNPAKTLVNFDLEVNRATVSKLEGGGGGNDGAFPYCGTLINSKTLDITKDRDRGKITYTTRTAVKRVAPTQDVDDEEELLAPPKRRKTSNNENGSAVYSSLTVEFTRVPGQTFERKLLNAFKIQSHLMFLDTSHNDSATVLSNLFSAFVETASKAWAYARCLSSFSSSSPSTSASTSGRPNNKITNVKKNKNKNKIDKGHQDPTARLLIRAVAKLVDVAFLLAQSKARRTRYPGYVCDVRRNEVAWLAYHAFLRVLGRKQARYGEVLAWLRAEINKLGSLKDIRTGRVRGVVDL
ncbi:hypothetical protein PG996_002509 [Apiospora saccharicola]|uniref:Telomerase reverse transcriptase n=1 Tax=Apiospora saccharicola TaxID=335842 RepID=A0ABR1WJP5_9PEZI